MNSFIPSAKTFECTHGRTNDFLVQIYKNPETNHFHWIMAFAGSLDACHPDHNKVFESPQGYDNVTLCRDDATKKSRKLSDESFDYYLNIKLSKNV